MESFSGLCEHCTTGYALPGTPTGSTVTLDGTIAYFSPGSTAHDKAIVIATDIFGLPGGNNQLIADELAKRAGVDVWPAKPALRSSLWDKIKLYCLILNWIPFIIRNRGGVLDARIENFTKSLKREKKYEKIGGIVITLAATDLFSTVVVAHPSPPGASLENAKKIKVPSSWICPEEDHRLNSFRNEAEAFFASRQDGPAYEFKDYKGTTHGFAARPNLAIPTVKDAFLESLQQTVAWFSRTL
ncbi:hypothetical protein BOTBODRAFT_35231 [Botryobasidium botryosum FD-172 SS1]|uniref:Dienelactone hydrolase domain-containing protein n=1 Tax=Botryobasidium botryosum (strain FD-172 SS1) TaxID=930990 RepID=A0A067MJ13_BOTB1|nr:hypothetical protein BOTBODRAFT_35231 [Botryobasidium botryosum FD-172 SS1]